MMVGVDISNGCEFRHRGQSRVLHGARCVRHEAGGCCPRAGNRSSTSRPRDRISANRVTR